MEEQEREHIARAVQSIQRLIMSVGLHARISGCPSRARALAAFLDYVMQHDAVWVARRIDIARHWIREHPAPLP